MISATVEPCGPTGGVGITGVDGADVDQFTVNVTAFRRLRPSDQTRSDSVRSPGIPAIGEASGPVDTVVDGAS